MTKATKFIREAAARTRADGVTVDMDSPYSTVAIDAPGQDGVFMQGDEADQTNQQPTKSKYLVALPIFRGEKGFNHPTILVSATSESDAVAIVRHLRPHDYIGDIKRVSY